MHRVMDSNNLAKANSYPLPISPRPEGRGKNNSEGETITTLKGMPLPRPLGRGLVSMFYRALAQSSLIVKMNFMPLIRVLIYNALVN